MTAFVLVHGAWHGAWCRAGACPSPSSLPPTATAPADSTSGHDAMLIAPEALTALLIESTGP